jgi:hypothetical protein
MRKKEKRKKGNEHGMNHGFLLENVHDLATQKKWLANPTKGFLRFKKNNSPYLDQKNLEVAKFKHCVFVGCQN